METTKDTDILKTIVDTGVEASEMGRLDFQALPDYAGYLLREKLDELSADQYRLSRELRLPLLRYFSHLSEPRLLEIAKNGLLNLLTALEQNNIRAYISTSVERWVNDQMQEISRNQIVADDISLLNFIRRKTFRDLLGGFTNDAAIWCKIMEELDVFLTELERGSFKAMFAIQHELHEQAQRLAHIGTWLWDLSTNNLVWSGELYRIYELQPQDKITFELVASFNHPDDAAMVSTQMRISLETHQPHDFYYRIVLPSRSEKYLHARGQVLSDNQGKPAKLFGTLQDVTAQKKIEKAHTEYKNFIEKITNLTPSLIAVYNIKTGKYLFLSKALETLLGYEPQLVLEKGADFFMEITHPEDVARIIAENTQAIKDLNASTQRNSVGEIREFRYRMRHADGEYRWIHTYGTVFERDEHNQIETVINISNDVTEQMVNRTLLYQKTVEIERQEDRFHKMIDGVEDYAILLLTKDGFIENWNKGAEKIKGYRAEEIIGRHLRTFYPQEDQARELPESLLIRTATSGKATHEGWQVRKDGSRFWAYVVITALRDKTGELIGFSKVTRDLTSKKIAEENLLLYTRQLEKKNEELETKNKELESFTYIASHDLQEPLRKVKLWSNRLEELGNAPDKVKEGLGKIKSSTSRMQALIDGLLKYTRVADPRATAEPVDLNAIVDDVLNEYSELLEEKNAVVNKADLPSFRAIKLQMEQLFSNLISNAIKYAKQDVPLVIDIHSIIVSGRDRETGDFYQLSVADNGIGFEQEFADRIFEIFQRLDNSSHTGTGIGLAICKKIVQNHGGWIRAVSEPGKGTTIYFTIPVAGKPTLPGIAVQ